MRSARTFLDCGYTMCLGAASAKQRLDVAIRDSIRNGDIPGPRFLANGREMAPADGALIAGITRFAESADDIRQAIKEMDEEIGVDTVSYARPRFRPLVLTPRPQIKLSMSGEEITETLRAEDTTFPDDVVAAAVDEAHNRNIRVCSHARSDEAIVQCLQYGVDVIYHASFCSQETMKALEYQKDRVYVIPAINWLVGTLNDAAAFGYPVSKAESVGYARELEIATVGLKEMHKRGIKILPGGDYGFACTPRGLVKRTVLHQIAY